MPGGGSMFTEKELAEQQEAEAFMTHVVVVEDGDDQKVVPLRSMMATAILFAGDYLEELVLGADFTLVLHSSVTDDDPRREAFDAAYLSLKQQYMADLDKAANSIFGGDVMTQQDMDALAHDGFRATKGLLPERKPMPQPEPNPHAGFDSDSPPEVTG